ncbi:MAG: molecular chaperone HtpG [Gammaproteobacteria bacterium]
MIEVKKETLGFQSEVRQLLDLMIHSLYSNPEIFLRELISNSADACDKLRFEALGKDELYEGDSGLQIEVDYSDKQNTITVRDNGLGMSRQEVVDNLGTIARSGTKEFFKAMTGDQQKDSQLIGQFGVGFYSVFIVADQVTLTTRRAGLTEDEGVRWESDGKGEYSVQTVKRKKRGTEVVLHLKKEAKEFADGFRLRAIIKKYSDHITAPILMPKEGEKAEGYEAVNSATALWKRPKKDIADEEYNEFYKHIAHDFEAPMARVHSRVEGKREYTSLFFIPSRAPFDLWDRDSRRGIKLYVRRVFIMDDAEQLMPPYLRFVRGLVDSDDLPLNISREILQRNKTVDTIRAASVKKVLGTIENLAKSETYAKFWEQFGRVFKEGVVDDPDNKERIAKLLRFSSTHEDKEQPEVSLEAYASRMKADQKHIYYVSADSFQTAKNSPHLEVFREKGIEVVLLSDPIDEWLVTHLREFSGKELRSVSKGDLDLGKLEDVEEKKKSAEKGGEYGDLIKRMKKLLEDKVEEVRLSSRLTTSPACLVAGEGALSANLERLLMAAGQDIKGAKPIMEINSQHPILERLKAEQDEQRFEDWAKILFDQALLSEGGKLDDPAGFVHRLNQMFLVLTSQPSA